mgnify:CR=1 FL=1
MGLVITLAVVGGLILALVLYRLIYWVTRTTPFGYLYNDRGLLVVDFSKLRRKSVDDLRSRDKIPGTPESEGSDTVCSAVSARLNTEPHRCAEIEV